jgi:uncharacterized membrane protein (DUF485 family)
MIMSDSNSSGPPAGLILSRNNRWGLVLFAIYLSFYVAYVIVNAFWPGTMDLVIWRGLNLAVASGLGLIIGAFLLAVVYALGCRGDTKENS